jgi:hypothetical protein
MHDAAVCKVHHYGAVVSMFHALWQINHIMAWATPDEGQLI